MMIHIEFQVIHELNCNGRDATRAYGIDFLESGGIIRIGYVEVPIADHCSRDVYMTLNTVHYREVRHHEKGFRQGI